MSQINVNRIKDSNEGAPDFPSGVNVSGVTSTVTLGVTNLTATNLNVSGVVTATTLDGNLLSTGTPTLGLGVTINASGLNISGVATAGIVSATTLYGDGSNMTGIALTIAPLNYNPAVFGVDVGTSQGIGITFNQAVKAGSGNVTLRLVGAAGTVVENFGVGNSVTYGNSDYGTTISITPTADLANDTVYHLSYPSGAFTTIGGDVSYVGTAYTFDTKSIEYQLWAWGRNTAGHLGQNNIVSYSSPVQIPGITWGQAEGELSKGSASLLTRTDGTLWVMGSNSVGELGLNNKTSYSSPVQLPGTDWSYVGASNENSAAINTDGELWVWGNNENGMLGQNAPVTSHVSSPVQIPGTTWSKVEGSQYGKFGIKTDGTLWSWGYGVAGQLGLNNEVKYSSPVQIPGTTWSKVKPGARTGLAIKTDGTLWSWGYGKNGVTGHNNTTSYSSPKQIPGTTWTDVGGGGTSDGMSAAIKTDGTLWTWGTNSNRGQLGLNDVVNRSSPTQVPGTTWSKIEVGAANWGAIKTDGTLWMCGSNEYAYGALGQNNLTTYSSPIQVPGTWVDIIAPGGSGTDPVFYAVKEV